VAPAQHGRADRLIEGLEEAAGQVRSLSRALLPVDVEAEDLADAIDTLVRRFHALGAMQCRFESDSHLPLHDSAVATHLFRIVQEALQNAVEHSGADTVTVRVHDGDRLVVEVEDDGHGFDDRKALGVGQRIMQHRADTIGARLTVESSAEGTRVRCELEPQTAEGYARGR
jgi:signal transduction histidine kinase